MRLVEIIPEHSCWEWTASKFRDGYGQIKVNRKNKKAHRIAYELFKGPIPENMLVCHTCDNPGCVRPEHLFLGTALDNSHDMINKGRYNNGKSDITQCPYGHLYTEENTYRHNNNRQCRNCTIRRATDRQKKK
jgi:HNH endonuclease